MLGALILILIALVILAGLGVLTVIVDALTRIVLAIPDGLWLLIFLIAIAWLIFVYLPRRR